MVSERRPRLRPLSSAVIENLAPSASGTPEAELLDRLEEALSRLPAEERAAAVTAFGYGEGPSGVAQEQNLPAGEADALSRNALQLLRGALADLEPGNPDHYPRTPPRRRSQRPPEA
jgi:DNA-directed RNA polymerase specialized sigma24 family protein